MTGLHVFFAARRVSWLGAVVASAVACSASPPPVNHGPHSPTAVVTRDTEFHGTLVDPPLHRPPVVLTTTDGQRFDLARRPSGRVTVLFFGFTHCDDVCPTTMADLAAARRALPAGLRENLQVEFVTVDPARDTPEVLRHWLDRYDDDFIGLNGSSNTVRRAEKSLYAPISHLPRQTYGEETAASPATRPHGYQIDHSGTVYVFAPRQRTLIYTGGTTPQQYAQDFTHLLRS
ncbi:MAG: SCO family protein [Nocardioidaceae bacterium]